MKTALLFSLSFLMVQGAFARDRNTVTIGINVRNDREELLVCQKKLNNANFDNRTLRNELAICQADLSQASQRGDREINELRRENFELRRQIDELLAAERERHERRNFGSFSYAACQDYMGKTNLKNVASGEAEMALEAETLAQNNLSKIVNCSYGQTIVKTEKLTTNEPRVYCTASCLDYMGNINSKNIKGARGRNQAEAEFLAIQAVNASVSCTYGTAVKSCE